MGYDTDVKENTVEGMVSILQYLMLKNYSSPLVKCGLHTCKKKKNSNVNFPNN